jgi:hypothetical protein
MLQKLGAIGKKISQLSQEATMPNDVKAILSLITLVAGVLAAFWERSIGKGHLFWLMIGFAIFAVVAMWVFPEAQARKKGTPKKL